MLVKAVGIVMMLDGVMSALMAAAIVDTFVYRSLRDQSLAVAHFLIGALLFLAGRQVFAEKRDRDSFSRNESRSRFHAQLGATALIAALAIAAAEATRFDWLTLALRAAYTALMLLILFRTTLPKT